MKAHGIVHKYGDNVDTDVIIPARYLNTASHKELAAHCMEDIDADFVKNVKEGDIIVAEKNFGCGSSREHAPIAIKASGISCVIASTFLQGFSIVILSISDFQFSNVMRQLTRLKTAMKLILILIQALSQMLQQVRPTKQSHSLSLFRISSRTAGLSIMLLRSNI